MIKNIVLDFGHGGIDANGHYTTPGKRHQFSNGEIAYEGVINRRIGGMVQAYLRMFDDRLNIVTTVGADESHDLSLAERVQIANRLPASETIFISVHCNAFNTKARGFEIFTTIGHTKSDLLAESIANAVEPLYKQLKLHLRYDMRDGDKDKESEFYVIKNTNCPAVLLECLFFDNLEDFAFLKNPSFVRDLSWAIYNGIQTYIKSIH
jgi:N-acetylmuramoyl-L-alanine amidase